ncbi:hypothetical protein cyc_08722 [Cyclospora cayetanensis]|uniref:Uncharacterized protein n=1 Tax=Cyclospora cayetanensis TaxID=88456 RepID=A0A1D3CS61_9EIME|nr:hypothetical protein cyc_08722 [Cyclospora cayetanensis]
MQRQRRPQVKQEQAAEVAETTLALIGDYSSPAMKAVREYELKQLGKIAGTTLELFIILSQGPGNEAAKELGMGHHIGLLAAMPRLLHDTQMLQKKRRRMKMRSRKKWKTRTMALKKPSPKQAYKKTKKSVSRISLERNNRLAAGDVPQWSTAVEPGEKAEGYLGGSRNPREGQVQANDGKRRWCYRGSPEQETTATSA